MSQDHDYDLTKKVRISFKGMDYFVMPRYKDHYLNHEYERFSLQILKNNLHPGTTFVDIGAHYGAYSLYAAEAAGSEVIALEPVSENYELLKQNIDANKLGSLVKAYQYAASNKDGEAEFNIPWASDSAGFYEHPNAETIRKQKVTVKKIDHVIGKRKVDLIKIDTEGHEMSVLEGLSNTFKNNPHLKLIVELNPECLKRAGQSVEKLLAAITELDKNIYIVDEDKFTLYKLSSNDLSRWRKYVSNSGYANIYCVPKTGDKYLLAISHSSGVDGAELALLDQAVAARNSGTTTHVILPSHGPLVARLIEAGIGYSIVEDYSPWAIPQHVTISNEALRNYLNMNAAISIIDKANEIGPDFIMNNTLVNPWGVLASKQLGLPLIWMIHEYGDLDHNLIFQHGIQNTKKFVLQNADLVLCCSDAVRAKLIDSSKKAPKVNTMYNLIDFNKILQASKAEVKNGFNEDAELKLCIVGTIKPEKGQILAIQTLAELHKTGRNAQLLIVGSGDENYTKELRKSVERLNLTKAVKFLGHKDNPYPYIKSADILLVCSNNEAFGRTIAEAMVLGTPVVASAAGGALELIEDGKTGFLFKSQDATDLLAKIIKLSSADRDAVAKNATHSIGKILDPSATVDAWNRWTEKLMAEKKSGLEKIFVSEWVDAFNISQEDSDNKSQIIEALDMRNTELIKETTKMNEENKRIHRELLQTTNELKRLQNSKSWKVTKPLRSASAAVRRKKE